MDWMKLGLAIFVGTMEFVKAMRDEVSLDELADKAVAYIVEAKSERAAAEKAEDAVFENGEKYD